MANSEMDRVSAERKRKGEGEGERVRLSEKTWVSLAGRDAVSCDSCILHLRGLP